MRQAEAVSGRNEELRYGGTGFRQLGGNEGGYIVKAILTFFSKVLECLSANTISPPALSHSNYSNFLISREC